MTVFLFQHNTTHQKQVSDFISFGFWFCLRSQMLGENKDDTLIMFVIGNQKKIFLTEKLIDTTWYRSHISGTSWISSG